jgi:hypothetical protein
LPDDHGKFFTGFELVLFFPHPVLSFHRAHEARAVHVVGLFLSEKLPNGITYII